MSNSASRADVELTVARPKPFGLELGSVGFAVAVFFVVHLVSYGIWLLFVDPKIAVWKFYPQPFGVYLFWCLMILVWVGFYFGMHGFSKIRQPAMGIMATAFMLVLAFCVPMLLIFGWGSLDPAFSPVNFAGHGISGAIVLIGFYGFAFWANSTDGWPWTDAGLKQPMLGVAQVLVGFFCTTILYLVLIYSNVAVWATPGKAIMSMPTVMGWFVGVLLSWVTTVMLTDMWPYTYFKSRAGRAIGAFVGNFVLGTGIYYFLLALVKNVLIPADALEKIGPAINLWPAQVGIWIAFWMFFWALACGNRPNSVSPVMNRITRCVIVYGLGIVSFVIHTRWFGINVLHEASVVPGFGGDPLTMVTLLALVLLVYVVFFGCYGIRRKA